MPPGHDPASVDTGNAVTSLYREVNKFALVRKEIEAIVAMI